MGPLTAEAFAGLRLPAGSELRHGAVVRTATPPPPRRAARLVRQLAPLVAAAGGWASSELVVVLGRDPDSAARPYCSVGLAEPPAGGAAERAPELVVVLGGAGGARRWLRAGAAVVWTVEATSAWVHARGRPAVRRELGECLDVPDVAALAAVTVAVTSLCGLPMVGE